MCWKEFHFDDAFRPIHSETAFNNFLVTSRPQAAPSPALEDTPNGLFARTLYIEGGETELNDVELNRNLNLKKLYICNTFLKVSLKTGKHLIIKSI